MTTSEKKTTASESNAQPEAWVGAITDLLTRLESGNLEQNIHKLEDFFFGEGTFAELQGLPKPILFEMAEKGYLYLKAGRLKRAQEVFQALCVLDHKTAYFQTALGAVYQKQEQYIDALAAYTVALELDPKDITAYTNRGEVYYLLGYNDEPLADFEAAIQLDPEGKDPWANRARLLKKQLLQLIEEDKK